jgi:hypothetical protein
VSNRNKLSDTQEEGEEIQTEGKTPLRLAVECRHLATAQNLSATSAQLLQLSKALNSQLNFPLDPSANIHPVHSPCISSNDLGSVPSRM